jgi:AcrR family transcriptional regulator
MPEPGTSAPARPRVAGAREDELLEAAVTELLAVGYDRLTMDGVALRARASKATLYRRWSTKQSLVVDAVMRSKQAVTLAPPDTGALRTDLVELFCGPRGLAVHGSTRVLGVVVSALQTDPAFASEFRSKFLKPKIEAMQGIYRRAAARGEVAPGVDLALLGPALPGILLHRSFVLGEPITRDLVEHVVDQIILPAARAGHPASDNASHPTDQDPS